MAWLALVLVGGIPLAMFGVVALLGRQRSTIILGLATVLLAVAQFASSHLPHDRWVWAAAAFACGSLVGILGFFLLWLYERDKTWSHWLKESVQDKRTRIAVAAAFMAVVLTGIFGNWAHAEAGQSKFWFGFYQSWTAGFVGVLLFSVATTLITLYRPEDEDFERRVRILFGGRTGKHMDFIVDEVKRLGYFAETVERVYTIEEIRPADGRYRVHVTHRARLHHYIPDVGVSDKLIFEYTPDDLVGEMSGGHLISAGWKLPEQKIYTSVLADDEDLGIVVPTGCNKSWDIEIPKGKPIDVEVQFRVWGKIGEIEEFEPVRFARQVRTEVDCRCGNSRLRLEGHVGGEAVQAPLVSGEKITFPDIRDWEPNKKIYSFRLLHASAGASSA